MSAEDELRPIRALNDALTIVMQSMPRPAGKEDWQYRDMPKVRKDFFDKFLGIVGDCNIAWITRAVYRYDDGEYHRGQFWISPDGIENLKKYSASSEEG